MKKENFRKLSISTWAALRKVAIKALDQSKKQDEVSKLVAVTRQTMSVWVDERKKSDGSQYIEDEEARRIEIKEN